METETANKAQNLTDIPSPESQSKPPIINKVVIIGGILLLLIVGSGGYYLGMQRVQPQIPHSSPQATQTQPSSTGEQQNQESTKTALEGSFQDTLIKNCENYELQKGVAFVDVIDVNKAPVSINKNLININYRVPNKLLCAGFDGTKSPYNYFFIELQDKSMINVYDNNSKELGHGGPPYIGSYGTVIRDDGNIKLTVYMVGNEGPTLVGYAPVELRGEKRLKLSNGDTVYANYSKTAIEGKDSRLVEFLQPYSKPSDFKPGAKEVTDFPAEELKNKFFSNLSNLQPSEKNVLSEIERVLSAVSPK